MSIATRARSVLDPSRFLSFRSNAHSERVAATLGITLGVGFLVCFATGVFSHLMQSPRPGGFYLRARQGSYRVTQGVHVATGIFLIPVILAKLWSIYPKLFEWPPVTGVAHLLERMSLLPLIGGGLFMLITGVVNTYQWYFFSVLLPAAHYSVAWVTIGALIVHIGAKWTITRRNVSRRTDVHDPHDPHDPHEENPDAISRRSFLTGTFGAGAVLTLFSVGQSFSPLGNFALLAPRRPDAGPQNLPVNKSAASAGVIRTAHASDYMLRVDGNVERPLAMTLDELRSLPQHVAELPITCVEGWSATGNWKGIRVRDLVDMAGGSTGSGVRVESFQESGAYTQSFLNKNHASDVDTLLALELNGEPLHIDHGFPCRLIAPNRPGVFQTKWVNRLVVE